MKMSAPLATILAIATVPLLFLQCEPEGPETDGTINASVSLFSNAAMQGKITISQAYANVSQITIHATAPTQDVLTFSRSVSPDHSWISLLDKNQKPVEITGRISNYHPFTVTLVLGEDPYPLTFSEVEGGQTSNLAAYLEEARPALMIAARFDNRGRSIPLYVAIPNAIPLQTTGTQYGNPQVQIDLENRAEIQINPSYLFGDITTQSLENATKVIHQEQEAILIHPLINPGLYTSIRTRLEDAGNSVMAKITVTRSVGKQ